jgi:hypothetical protein
MTDRRGISLFQEKIHNVHINWVFNGRNILLACANNRPFNTGMQDVINIHVKIVKFTGLLQVATSLQLFKS